MCSLSCNKREHYISGFDCYATKTGSESLSKTGKLKNCRHGQSAIISDTDYAKIRKQFVHTKYRLLLDLARFTGERWGALIQLRVEDIFDESGRPLDTITFRAQTRKASPDGKRHTRQIPVSSQLRELLEAYRLPLTRGWLFESPMIPGQPITLRSADFVFRAAVAQAGLDHKGYSTHSTRRTFITRLYERGVDLHTIQQLTGHHDLKALIRYIEFNPDRARSAIALL